MRRKLMKYLKDVNVKKVKIDVSQPSVFMRAAAHNKTIKIDKKLN